MSDLPKDSIEVRMKEYADRMKDEPKYSSDSHGPDAPLVSDSLFDFLMHLRKNSDTFDPMYYDTNLVSGDPMDEVFARQLVHDYTGEATDLPLLTDEIRDDYRGSGLASQH